MSYKIEIAKGAAATGLSPLSATQALQRLEDAEARGLAVFCKDAEGKPVSKEQLRQSAGHKSAEDWR